MNERTRVLHIAEAAGGIERYLTSLLKYSDSSKIESILLCSQNFDSAKFIDKTSKIDQMQMPHQICLKDLKVISQVRSKIKKYKPDVIYAHSSKAGAYARIAALGLNTRTIYNPHGWAFNMQISKTKKRLYWIIEKLLSHLTDTIICISNFEKETAINTGLTPPKKLHVIKNGIDYDEFKSSPIITREKLGIPDDAIVIGQVGRLAEQKAPDSFVKMAKLIKNQIPKAYFIIVGDGPLRQQTENLIRMYNLSDSFLITGWVDYPISYERLFDISVLLSRWEGFGLVLPEYMYFNKPIVATKVEAISEVLQNYDQAYLVKSGDSSSAASCIVSVLKENKPVGKLKAKNIYDIKTTAELTDDLILNQ